MKDGPLSDMSASWRPQSKKYVCNVKMSAKLNENEPNLLSNTHNLPIYIR
jgi:hypothetical protein